MRLARIIGAGLAKQLCFLGHRFTGEEGVALRIINEVCSPEDLEKQALAMAEELLLIPFTALKHTKLQIDRSFDLDFETLLTEMIDAIDDCLRSSEHKEVMLEYREELTRHDN
jgi:enoyl-CoA hydratase/carnithine racemase